MACAALLLVACDAYDPDAIMRPDDKHDKDASTDGATPVPDGGDGGAIDGGMCVPSAEICNGVDDDCNGTRDDKDAANAYCEAVVVHAVTGCRAGKCVPFDCDQGFKNCDGDPSNGCEPLCSVCGICDDGGVDDGGVGDAGH